MSRSEILIECSYAFSREVPAEERSEAANYGSAFHAGLATLIAGTPRLATREVLALVRKWDLADHVAEELQETIPAAHAELRRWLASNEFKIDFSRVHLHTERSLALAPLRGSRTIAPPDEDHVYRAVRPGELPGTADVDGYENKHDVVLVLDHKTGEEDFSRPLEKAQLLSLAAAAVRLPRPRGTTQSPRRLPDVILGALHARRRGLPKVYAERIRAEELRPHEVRLKAGLEDIGSGRLRPGPQCDRCPGQAICPARGGQLTERGVDVLRGLVGAANPMGAVLPANGQENPTGSLSRAARLGRLYDALTAAEKMAAQGRKEIRREIEMTGIMPETAKGYLRLISYRRESVSKNSILQAYGKLKGERMLSQLRKDGAMNVTEGKQLDVEKERGS